MARSYQGVALIMIAMLVTFTEAGYYQRRAMQQHGYGYYQQDANQQHRYYANKQQDRDAMQQHGYGYYQQDANQQHRYYANQQQDRDAMQQHGYYQQDANQQHGYYQQDANQQHGYYQQDANQQHGYYQQDANQQHGYYQQDANQQHGYYQQDANQQHGYGYYLANQQAASCVDEIESPSKTFTICVKKGEICTNVNVPACTSSATDCQKIGEDNEALKAFVSQHPEVYADECKESDGKQCLYTDVTYDTCTTAKTMADEKICIKLSDGTERCSKLMDLVKIAANEEEPGTEIPPFKPTD